WGGVGCGCVMGVTAGAGVATGAEGVGCFVGAGVGGAEVGRGVGGAEGRGAGVDCRATGGGVELAGTAGCWLDSTGALSVADGVSSVVAEGSEITPGLEAGLGGDVVTGRATSVAYGERGAAAGVARGPVAVRPPHGDA